MGKRTTYEPGTFSAVDLSTPDPEAAKRFYGELFGWAAEEIQGGGDASYTLLTLGGDYVAGLFSQPEQQRAAGVPPHWFSYVSVASADDAAARAQELGGSIHAEPVAVMDAGRMAVLADPTGAMFGAWEPRQVAGAARVNDPGCLTSNELATDDVELAAAFYTALFGWQIEEVAGEDGARYWLIGHAGAARGRNGGMRELGPRQADVPPHWLPYFTVESIEEAVEAVTRGGGAVHAGPLEIPAGRIAIVSDPQGATFGIYEGEVDD